MFGIIRKMYPAVDPSHRGVHSHGGDAVEMVHSTEYGRLTLLIGACIRTALPTTSRMTRLNGG